MRWLKTRLVFLGIAAFEFAVVALFAAVLGASLALLGVWVFP